MTTRVKSRSTKILFVSSSEWNVRLSRKQQGCQVTARRLSDSTNRLEKRGHGEMLLCTFLINFCVNSSTQFSETVAPLNRSTQFSESQTVTPLNSSTQFSETVTLLNSSTQFSETVAPLNSSTQFSETVTSTVTPFSFNFHHPAYGHLRIQL